MQKNLATRIAKYNKWYAIALVALVGTLYVLEASTYQPQCRPIKTIKA